MKNVESRQLTEASLGTRSYGRNLVGDIENAVIKKKQKPGTCPAQLVTNIKEIYQNLRSMNLCHSEINDSIRMQSIREISRPLSDAYRRNARVKCAVLHISFLSIFRICSYVFIGFMRAYVGSGRGRGGGENG